MQIQLTSYLTAAGKLAGKAMKNAYLHILSEYLCSKEVNITRHAWVLLKVAASCLSPLLTAVVSNNHPGMFLEQYSRLEQFFKIIIIYAPPSVLDLIFLPLQFLRRMPLSSNWREIL